MATFSKRKTLLSQGLAQQCLIGITLVILGATLSAPTSATEKVTWWNLSKFLREFVNNGLVANKLQEKLDTGYKWKTTEVDGKERLNIISSRVSDIFNRSISVVQSLKRVIEEEYDNWPVYSHKNNNSRFCCDLEPVDNSSDGCALLVRSEQANTTSESGRAILPPESVLREFKKATNILGRNITQYFAFNDGSLYMYPAQSMQNLSACKTYDPRLRYFFTQSKSPEAREVVLVVNIGPNADVDFLQKVVERILKALSPIDRMALCLPDEDKCRTRPAGSLTEEPIWPRQDCPLGISSILGDVVASSENNKKLIHQQLKSWLQNQSRLPANGEQETPESFSNHVAALEAGHTLLQRQTSSPYQLHVGAYQKVLVYVTAINGWYHELSDHVNKTIWNSVHAVIHPVQGAAEELEALGLEGEDSMNYNNITAKIFPFANLTALYSSPTSIPSFGLKDPDHPVIPTPYWDAFGDGYIMSICLPLTKGTEFLGTACTDLSIVNLLEDKTNVDDIEDAYVFIVNSLGNTLMHPLLPSPHSITQDPSYVTINRLEQAEEVQTLLLDIVRHFPGMKVVQGIQVQPIGRPRGSGVPSPVKIVRRDLRYQWEPIIDTDLTIALVLPLRDGKVLSSEYTCFNASSCKTNHFHYHLPRPSIDRHKTCRFFGTEVLNNTGLVKFAPSCFIDVMSYIQDEGPAQFKKLTSIFNGTSPPDELLRSNLQASVKLLEQAEELWQQQLQKDPNVNKYIGARYMGTADGAFISYPGTSLRQAYDHRKRPWYLRAVSSKQKTSIAMTTPYCDELGAGMVYTITKTLHDVAGDPTAVVAGDVTLQYIMTNFHTQIPHCKTHTCLLVDRLGYVVLKSDWLTYHTSRSSCQQNTEIVGAHLNRLAPDIARDMIASKILRRRACHDYEQDITFYYWSLSLPGYRTLHTGKMYVAQKIPETNLYLVIRTEGLLDGYCNCDPYLRGESVECHDTCAFECECPCVGGLHTVPCHNPEADVHNFPVPPCKPRGLTSVRANNTTRGDLQPCNQHTMLCAGREEQDCSKFVVCLWAGGECQHVD